MPVPIDLYYLLLMPNISQFLAAAIFMYLLLFLSFLFRSYHRENQNSVPASYILTIYMWSVVVLQHSTSADETSFCIPQYPLVLYYWELTSKPAIISLHATALTIQEGNFKRNKTTNPVCSKQNQQPVELDDLDSFGLVSNLLFIIPSIPGKVFTRKQNTQTHWS